MFWDLHGVPCESGHSHCRKISSQRLCGICVQEMVVAQAVRFSFSLLRQSSYTGWKQIKMRALNAPISRIDHGASLDGHALTLV